MRAGAVYCFCLGAVRATLLVRAPNGQFYCDDDSGAGLNPALTIRNPQSGTYSVWVGSYRQGEFARATLSISELGLQ